MMDIVLKRVVVHRSTGVVNPSKVQIAALPEQEAEAVAVQKNVSFRQSRLSVNPVDLVIDQNPSQATKVSILRRRLANRIQCTDRSP